MMLIAFCQLLLHHGYGVFCLYGSQCVAGMLLGQGNDATSSLGAF